MTTVSSAIRPLLLRAFLVMQQHPELTGMSARTLRAIWHSRHRIDAQFRRNPVNRKLFLQILQQRAASCTSCAA